MHPRRRTCHAAVQCRSTVVYLGLLAIALAAGAGSLAAAEPLKVCLVSGSLEYKSNESLAGLQKFLEDRYSVRCTRAFIEGTDEEHLPGLEQLEDADVVLLFTRRLRLSGDDLARIKRYCESGRPLVGCAPPVTRSRPGWSWTSSCSAAITRGTMARGRKPRSR